MTRSELLRMIGAAYDSAFQPERWFALLDEICQAFGATSALLTRVRDFNTPLETWSVRFDPDCLAARFERFATPETNPGVRAYASMAIGQVIRRQQILSDEAFLEDPAAQAILVQQGLFHSALSTLERSGSSMTTLGLFRTKGTGAFDAGEIERFKQLTPHLVRTLAFQRHMHEAALLQSQTEQALDRLSVGFLLLAGGGQVLFANDAARRILAGHPGLALRHDRLVAERSVDAAQLGALLARADCRGAPCIGGAICVPRSDDRPPVQLWAMPLPPDAGGPALMEPRAALCVMLVDPEQTPAVPTEILHSLWGLTKAEARLARALLAGERLEDYAARAEISMNTARTHLKAVFAKTETSRQAELIALLSRAPATPPEG